jgi:hypothetical protein
LEKPKPGMRNHLILPLYIFLLFSSCKKDDTGLPEAEKKCKFSVISYGETYHVSYTGDSLKSMLNADYFYRYYYDDSGWIFHIDKTYSNDTTKLLKTIDYTYDYTGAVVSILFKDFINGSSNERREDWTWTAGKLTNMDIFISGHLSYKYSFEYSGNNISKITSYPPIPGYTYLYFIYDLVKNPLYNNFKEVNYLFHTDFAQYPFYFANEYLPKGYHTETDTFIHPYSYTFDSRGNISSFHTDYFNLPDYIFAYDCD